MINQQTSLYHKIMEVVVKADPIGLLAGGAPNDEYDSEINRIIVGIKDISDEKSVLEVIYKVFVDSFGESAGIVENYKELAKEVFTIKSI